MKKIIILLAVVCTLSFFNQFAIGIDNDDGEILSAETITGTLDTKSDTDTFTFTASAGQTVIMQLSEESGNFDPGIDLYSPNGTMEKTSWSYTAAFIENYQLQNSGTYSIIIRDRGGNNVGNYSLSFLKINGATTSSQDTDGGQINAGDTKIGEIDYESDIDAYTFNANAGQSIVIQMSEESGNFDPGIDLYSPNGTMEKTSWSYTAAFIENYQLQNSGTYSIVVRDRGGDSIGSYSLSLSIIGSGTSNPPDIDQDGTYVDDEDDDNDGYTDYIENIMGTDPNDLNSKPTDSDKDGLPDLIDDDDDNDGYTDSEENKVGTDPFDKTDYPTNVDKQDTDKDGSTDNVDDDDDNDGYTDVQEFIERTDPLDSTISPKDIEKLDSDTDGKYDSMDTDDDNDGMPDQWELFYGFNPINSIDANQDADVDKYYNLIEFQGGSNPRDIDDYPNKGLSSIDILLIILSLIGGIVTITKIITTVIKNPVNVYKGKIKKTVSLDELKKLWIKDIQLEIDKKNLKPKQIKKIREGYEIQKKKLT